MDSFNSPWSSPQVLDGIANDALHMDIMTDLHETFEPQIRARSNTWPLPRPENFVEPTEDTGSNQQLASNGGQQIQSPGVAQTKKNSSRRNAWGNLSYADLITQAISSSTDNRLTLSQIYEWMVQNVSYFKDKGDSNSSAGWKNSIRHNLSLHNRFMRVQNEGTGKSSWWMLNPDAKPGKSVRRRAASMETSSKYEKRRGRAKKRVEALRNAGLSSALSVLNDATPSPSSSVSEGLDMYPDSPLHSSGFQLSPDFRQRASSNASSCGRLSPIPAIIGVEPEWGYDAGSQEFPQNDNNTIGLAQTAPGANATIDQLTGVLADDLNELLGFPNTPLQNQPPPPYQPPQPYSIHATIAQSYNRLQQNQCPIHRRQPCTCLHNSRESMSPASGSGVSPAYPHSEPSPDPMGNFKSTMIRSCIAPRPPSDSPPLTTIVTNNKYINNNNTSNINNNNNNNNNNCSNNNINSNTYNNINNNNNNNNINSSNNNNIDNSNNNNSNNNISSIIVNNKEYSPGMPSTLMGQFMEALNSQTNLDDLGLNIESFHGGLECNVDEVIQQELNIDGLLDINIPMTSQNQNVGSHTNTTLQSNTIGTVTLPQNQSNSSHNKVQYAQTSVTPPSWVH